MDYKFTFFMRQEAAGDADAQVKISCGGNVLEEALTISQTAENGSYTDAIGEKWQVVVVEASGLTTPAAGVSQTISVKLLNDYYVDSDTDRNVIINNIVWYTDKADGTNYKYLKFGATPADDVYETITDFTSNLGITNTQNNKPYTKLRTSTISSCDCEGWGEGYVKLTHEEEHNFSFLTEHSSDLQGDQYWTA